MNNPAIFFILFMIFLICLKSVKVIPKNSKGLVYRLGRMDKKPREPGLAILVPFFDQLKIVSTENEGMSIPSQTYISHDNKSLKAEADVHFQIMDPTKTTQVADLNSALQQITQTHIRTEIGKIDSGRIAGEHVFLVKRLQESLNAAVSAWGVQVNKVELRNIVNS